MIYLSIENPLFEEYISEHFIKDNTQYQKIQQNQLYRNLESLKNSILLIQSDSDEESSLNITKRLKRLLGLDIKIVFFSSDPRIESDAKNSCDVFLPAPSEFDSIMESIFRVTSTLHKILIIDDSKLVHSQLVPAIRDEGYEIYEAYNGREGYEMAIKLKPDLIICDIEMPVMNGFEACKLIRSNPATQDTYIIMSSTLGSASDMQKGFESGVDEYITKPVVIPELMERIGRVFKQSLSGREDILILEQDEILASNITKSLKKQGFSTKVVKTLNACNTQIRKGQYDLLVIDSDLKDGSAMNYILQLRNVSFTKKPSILLIMNRESASDAKMAINLGVSSVLSKPFSMDNMVAIIERILAVKRSNFEKDQLLKYMSKSSVRIAEEKAMISDSGSTGARAINNYASVFFSDIVGFTNRCERYTAEQVVEQINELFSVMSKTIQRHTGDIDKFMGDACMAFWMTEDPSVDNKNMVNAAIEIQKELEFLNANNKTLINDPIRIRIGMHSGEVILCDLGSPESRIDLTIIGDNVNLAARLESACKVYGIDILISESVMKDINQDYIIRLIDRVQVVGKENDSKIYEILIPNKNKSGELEELVAVFSNARDLYEEGKFKEALELFEKSHIMEPNREEMNPSKLYIQRCLKLIDTPPADWKGIWRLTSK